jgi:vitamin B12 transporter
LRYDDHSSFGSHLTPQVNLGYKQNENTNYYVSYSEFFVAPTPSQLYNTTYGNPNLQPEDGRTIEAGINHKFSNTLTGTFHVWQRNADNFIGYLNDIKKYANTNNEDARGWDVQLNKQVTNRLNATVGYTYTHMDPSYIGTTLNRAANYDGYLPKGEWRIGLDYQQESYNVQIQGRGVVDELGPQTADAFAGFFPETTYWIWDAAANYKVAKNAKVFVKVNNIFDKFYAEESNARTNWSGVPGEWWTCPGRNFQAGIQYQF